jgi:protein transport protein SEC31
MAPIGDVPNDPIESQQVSGSTNEQSMFGLASSQQRRYDVQWSPLRRGIVSTASLDRKVQAHSILGLAASGRPPKWMRPSSSVSCGFGGTIVTCGATDKVVRIRTVAEDPELDKLSRDFETTMDPNKIIDFCHSRAVMAGNNANEKRLWQFMQVIFQANARQQLLYTLGFDPTTIGEKAAAYEEERGITKGVGSMSLGDGSHNDTGMPQPTQDIVKQALMVGNFEAAVDCCFRTGNLADALVLASCGGADLWAKTQERYFRPLFKTLI